MSGIDWAYSILVSLATAYSKEHVKTRASQFTEETLEGCFGMACSDMDWPGKESKRYAYEMVRDVCQELTRGKK